MCAVAGKQDADKIKAYITEQMEKRIMVIDGAMGTTIQQYKFSEEDFRGACAPEATDGGDDTPIDPPVTRHRPASTHAACA